jgi:hypothetical protein
MDQESPMSTTTLDNPTDRLLREYQREDRRIQWLLRSIAITALGLALLSISTLLSL